MSLIREINEYQNIYAVTPHAAVKQHIRAPEDGHVNVRNM